MSALDEHGFLVMLSSDIMHECKAIFCTRIVQPWADPGGVQGVRTPAVLIRVPFLKVTLSINITGNA